MRSSLAPKRNGAPEEEEEAEELLPKKRRYLVQNAISARERFNNVDGQMQAPTGFSGFGGRPNLDEDELDTSDRSAPRSKTSVKFQTGGDFNP